MENSPLIVVIEPDPAVRHSLQFLLEAEGYAVRAFDGSNRPGPAEIAGVGCIVLAETLAPCGSLEVLRRLRGAGIVAPAILIVDRRGTWADEEARRLGIEEVLEKPCLDGMLADAVAGALPRPRPACAEASAARVRNSP